MTFIQFEESKQAGRPVELYDFRIAIMHWRYTSSAKAIDRLAATFEPRTISRSELTSDINDKAGDLKVTLPITDEFVQTFLGVSRSGGLATLTLYRTHRQDPDEETIVAFRGDITAPSIRKDGKEAELRCVSIMRAHSLLVPRRTYQSLCNHSLYDEQCGLNENDPAFEKFLTVTAVSSDGTVLTCDGASSFGADFFQAGFCEFESDFRPILNQSGDDLAINTPFFSSPVGETVRVVAGCRHRFFEDCRDKFDNTDNFGGFPYISTRNPYTTGII